jgi:DNA-binding response OmpR family regulator
MIEKVVEKEVPFAHSLEDASVEGEENGMSQPVNKKPQILLVEDNQELSHFLKQSLSKAYQVMEVEDGLLAYKQAQETMPDLIISDIMMPGMDGIMLSHKLKSDEQTSHIPIILLTAKADMETKLEGLQTGADDYLTKPFQIAELHLRINNLLEARKKLREKFNRQLTLQPSDIEVTSMDEKFLQKALTIMEANLANADFDVEAFCREMGMGRTQLHNKLSALLNQSATEFIRSMRMKRAANLLGQNGGNVSEIAFQVGFSSPNYFAKCFREFYGLTPSQYAREHLPSNPRQS